MKFPLLNSKFPLYFTFLPKQLSITVPVLALQLELISKLRDFPGGPVVKTSPSSIGDENLIPGQEAKIPQAAEQLSLCTATTKPVFWSLGASATESMCCTY